MANRMTRHQIRQKMRKQMLKWGMHEDEIALCLLEIRQRQTMKEKGVLDRRATLCTRPAFIIHRREFEQTANGHVEALIEELVLTLFK